MKPIKSDALWKSDFDPSPYFELVSATRDSAVSSMGSLPNGRSISIAAGKHGKIHVCLFDPFKSRIFLASKPNLIKEWVDGGGFIKSEEILKKTRAAAPELLEALRMIEECSSVYEPEEASKTLWRIRTMSARAIAKVEGEKK